MPDQSDQRAKELNRIPAHEAEAAAASREKKPHLTDAEATQQAQERAAHARATRAGQDDEATEEKTENGKAAKS